MPSIVYRIAFCLLFLVWCAGCSAWQPTKEVWKTTKGLWYTYVSPPATVDYDDKGSSPPEAISLSNALMAVDMELGKLDRVMQNADRPPTQAWLDQLFASFPWLSGFAGVKYDGQILGQQPPDSMKELDFIPLLYEDKKQNSRALRTDIQPSPLGPEIMLATPLYDGTDFLGIVVAYFDMRSLMRYSDNAQDIVVLCPQALLWPGKYDFAATPLAGVDWARVVAESASGTCSNATGSFYYMVRYLGNLPLVFAIPSRGAFPDGNGNLEQGQQFFPQEREKLPPPPLPERKNMREELTPAFEKPEPEPEPAPVAPPVPEASERNVIPQGSRDSVLLKKQRAASRRRQVQERDLAGDNVELRPQEQPKDTGPEIRLLPESSRPQEALPGGRPSPFGPREQAPTRPSPFGPAETAPEAAASPESDSRASQEEKPATPDIIASPPAPEESQAQPESREVRGPASTETSPPQAEIKEEPRKPAQLPGGRPSPFGPR